MFLKLFRLKNFDFIIKKSHKMEMNKIIAEKSEINKSESAENSAENTEDRPVVANSFSWSCPICFETLGSEGMVVCALASCRFSVHLICLDCYENMQATGRSMVCPICRDPIVGKVLPIHDLVDPSDRVAQAKLMSRFPHEVVDVDGLPPTLATLKARVVDRMGDIYFTERVKVLDKRKKEIEEIRNRRIQTVVDRVESFLKTGKDPGSSWLLTIKDAKDDFEFRFSVKDRRRDRMIQLNAFYEKLQVDVSKIFANSKIKVIMNLYSIEEIESPKTEINYMRIRVTLPTEM